ncbi:MAG: hypothetical protein ACOY82_15225 [Pseudomonadota bacterium]
MDRSFFVFALAGLLALFAPSTASANGAYAVADCSLQSNLCYGEGGSNSGPVHLIWSFDTNGTDAIFPQPCDDDTQCSFWCPRYPGWIVARLYVYDTSFNLLAVSEPAPALCTQQDQVLGGAAPSPGAPEG